MAKIEQTIVLNFQTQLQQAKSDILELAKLSQQAKIAPGQTGALSSPEVSAVEKAVSEQAVLSGVSPDEMKAVLEDINKILEKEITIKNRIDELSAKRLEIETKIKTQEQEKNTLISQGAQLLGLRADASLQEVTAAKRKLDTEIASGNATKEQLELHKQVSTVFDSLSTKNRSIGQLIRSNGTTTEDITNSIKEQDDAFDAVRLTIDKIKLTSEQRENIEANLTPIVLKQTQQVRELEQAQKKSAAAAKENAKAQDDINRSLKSTPKTFAEKATGAFLYFQAVQAIRRVARAAVTTLVELDRALTDIAIVTTMTREETQGLIGRYQEMAKQVGLTTTEVVKLSTAFFRQGREAEDALKLTQTAAVFARIAAINVNDAANFLTAAINGFNLAASESTRIIDRFAALGANAAASAQEIAIALSKVAPAAASAGVGIDNLMAFVTKAIETTREAPENIGTAFKTIFARMRQLTDIGKVDEDGTDVNNVEKALRNIGVELRDAQGEFRDLDKVLIDVGHRWPEISRSQQAYVATTLAGTRQQTRLIALFENFDRTLELIEVSQRSAGAAAIQHAKFMEGLEAATTNLKTSFQEFITSIANSDQMLFVIDGLRVGIDLLNTVFGKLILTGAIYKLGVMAMNNDQGRFYKTITGVKNGLMGMLQPFGFVTKAKDALILKTKALNNLLSQSNVLNLNMTGPLDAVMKKESILTKVRAKGLFALTSQSRAGIQGVANLNGMSLAQVKSIFILKKYTRVLDGNTFAGIKKIAVDKKMSVTQVLVGITAKAAGKAVAKASLTMIKAMAKLLLSPMALVIALGGIVLALKKMADATDTTNPMVAEFQIRIKKAAKVLQDMVKKIKEFFGNLMNGQGILSGFFRFFING
jgi:TP901 family phage tail tape measure protein